MVGLEDEPQEGAVWIESLARPARDSEGVGLAVDDGASLAMQAPPRRSLDGVAEHLDQRRADDQVLRRRGSTHGTTLAHAAIFCEGITDQAPAVGARGCAILHCAPVYRLWIAGFDRPGRVRPNARVPGTVGSRARAPSNDPRRTQSSR